MQGVIGNLDHDIHSFSHQKTVVSASVNVGYPYYGKWIARDYNHWSPERYDTYSMDPPEQCATAGARLVTKNVAGCAEFESIII